MRTWSPRVRVLLLVSALTLVGGTVAVRVTASPHAHLSALDRSTGTRRWRITLPSWGAAVIVAQDQDRIGVSACSHDISWYDVDRATGALTARRWTPADGNPPLASVWIDPAPYVDPPPVIAELSYDAGTRSIVSDRGWRVSVDVHGFARHVPVLLTDDTVYLVENAGQCPGWGDD